MQLETNCLTESKTVYIFLLFFSLVVFSAGCAGRQEEKPSLPRFDYEEEIRDTQSDTFSVRWWETFDDTQLTGLVETALADNFSLKSAYERMRSASAIYEQHRADFYPGLDGSLTAKRSEQPSGDITSSYSYDLTANYEIDLWGRIEAGAEAARYDYRASAEDLHTAAITISARVINTWARIIEEKNTLKIEDELIKTEQKLLELAKKRFRSGLMRLSEVSRRRRQLELTSSRRAAGRDRLNSFEHQLAVLLGKSPGFGLEIHRTELPALSSPPDSGLSIELIRRRPDVRASYYEIKAEDRRVARAISAQYPRINLSFSGSNSSDLLRDIFSDWVGSFAANIAGPLIDGGRQRAEVGRAQALRNQKIHDYGQTVLTALQEVQDALSKEASLRSQFDRNRRSHRLAEESYNQFRVRYRNGSADYAQVLEELKNLLEAKKDLITIRRSMVESRTELYRALSGGWEM